MSKSTDAATVAYNMTKAQQEALCDELLSIRTGVFRVAKQLVTKGLINSCYGLTPLGVEVRAILQASAVSA